MSELTPEEVSDTQNIAFLSFFLFLSILLCVKRQCPEFWATHSLCFMCMRILRASLHVMKYIYGFIIAFFSRLTPSPPLSLHCCEPFHCSNSITFATRNFYLLLLWYWKRRHKISALKLTYNKDILARPRRNSFVGTIFFWQLIKRVKFITLWSFAWTHAPNKIVAAFFPPNKHVYCVFLHTKKINLRLKQRR